MKKVDKSSFAGTKVDSEQVFKTRRSAKPIAKPDVSSSLRIDAKKVGSFLKSVNEAEYLYMRNCMGFVTVFRILSKGTN